MVWRNPRRVRTLHRASHEPVSILLYKRPKFLRRSTSDLLYHIVELVPSAVRNHVVQYTQHPSDCLWNSSLNEPLRHLGLSQIGMLELAASNLRQDLCDLNVSANTT
jgi:hypothetical protein